MLFDLDSDQELLRDTTARFLDGVVGVDEVRRLREADDLPDADYWRRGAELGWTSLLVDEAAGGGSVSGAGLVDLTLVAHEVGAHAAPGPLAAVNAAAATLGRHDPGHALLGPVLGGEALVVWATGEPAPSPGPNDPGLEIRVDGDDVVLSGVKRPVESASVASHLLVTGRTGDGLTQVLVPTDAAGVTLAPMTAVDLTRRFAKVTLDEVRLPLAAVVGEVGGAAADVALQWHQALVISVAEMVGAMQRAFDMTVEWAFDRYSFGRPLASYQALKHRFADMACWLEASHALADAAAAAVAAGDADGPKLASAAMAYAGDHGSELLQDCIQLHGGIGVTFEHDLHLFVRRHTLARTLYGTPADHRRRAADLVQEAAA